MMPRSLEGIWKIFKKAGHTFISITILLLVLQGGAQRGGGAHRDFHPVQPNQPIPLIPLEQESYIFEKVLVP